MHGKLKVMTTILMMVMGLAFAGNALAAPGTLHPVFPEGLPTNNAPAALAMVQARAAVDTSLAAGMARTTGDASYDPTAYRTLGYSQGAPPGSVNSGVSGSGSLTSSRDTRNCNVHSQMLVLINIHTSAKLFICVHCGNPRLFTPTMPVFHRFAKQTVVNFLKVVTVNKIICPNTTQEVPVTIIVTVRGRLTARTFGEASGIINAQLTASLTERVSVAIKAKCVVVPPPPSAACTIGGVPVPTVPPGFTVVNGECVVQTNIAEQNCKAMGGTFNGATQLCTIIQVNGSCSNIVVVNGNGNQVSVSQQGNCNTNVPIPQPQPPPPPPSPPSVSNLTAIQEVFTNEVRPNVCADINVPSGTAMVVFSAHLGSFGSGSFTVAGGFSHLCATYTAPSVTATDTITVTVYASGQQPVSASEPVTVLPRPSRP